MKAIPMTLMVLLAALSMISSGQTTGPERTLSSTTGAPTRTQLIDCTKYLPYSPDSNHIWNRVQNSMLLRTGPDGSKWGCDQVDPLLWPGSKHVLIGAKYKEAVALLHEFLNTHAERLVRDPLARALFQRNLLAVSFTGQPGRLASAITRLRAALNAAEMPLVVIRKERNSPNCWRR